MTIHANEQAGSWPDFHVARRSAEVAIVVRAWSREVERAIRDTGAGIVEFDGTWRGTGSDFDRLAEFGAELTDVVKTLCILTDLADFADFNEVYAGVFGEHRPARSTMGGALVAGAHVEIEAWAYKPA